MLCEAAVLTMLENGREPLALGRRRRYASRGQKRALLRRDGGCARPGCPEARIERLHAHHLRHWLFGGRTDLTNLALLCDADHGLAHDLDLVITRRDGDLIVLDRDGRRIWGRADAAFTDGLDGLDGLGAAEPTDGQDDTRFTGVPPLDQETGRHPVPAGTPAGCTASSRLPARRRRRMTPVRVAAPDRADLSRVLFPDGEPPDLPDTLEAGGERMNMAWAVSVLMDNHDVARRPASEVSVAL
jgi:hypothetical protein